MAGFGYVNDICIEINPRFLPVPAIQVPDHHIPDLQNVNYDFKKDREFLSSTPTRIEAPPVQLEVVKSKGPVTNPVQIAKPCPLPLERRAESVNVVKVNQHNHLEEFENRHNVFDQMELMSIDEKAALAELLGSPRMV